jgi:hypothetical protein
MPEGSGEGDFNPAAWLSRTDVSVSMNDDRGVISIETLQPILSLQDAVVFVQGRVAGGWND